MMRALFIATMLLVACASALAIDVEKNQKGPNTTSTENYKESGSAPSVVVIVNNAWDAVNNWLHRFHEEIIAAATVGLFLVTTALAVYTARLWGATSELVEGAEDSAVRQLRAYIAVLPGAFFEQEDRKSIRFEAQPYMINTGQTPARKVRIVSNTCIAPYPIPANFNFQLLHAEEASVSTIGSRLGNNHYSAAAVMYSVDDVSAIMTSKNWRLVTYGTVNYEDVFQKSRHTNFCFTFIWGSKGIATWMSYKDHNDAT